MASSVKVNKITPTTSCGTVTLGDSGDTISIPNGASLNIGGTVSGIEGILNWDTTAKTSGFTAVAGNGYFVNTTSAPITVTLPATPSAGDLIGVKDYALTAQTNNITLSRNGSNIQGVANDFVINTQGRSVTLIYVDSTQGWMITGASQASDIVEYATFITATGGTITTDGDYKIHTFTGPGTFCVSSLGGGGSPCAVASTVDYLVVAGGGGAGWGWGGGGGAGGFRESKDSTLNSPHVASPLAATTGITITATGYPITVGASGVGGAASCTPQGTQGSSSIFSTITSAGGGNGGGGGNPGGSGGSGGGGGNGGGAGSGNTPPVSPPQGQPGGGGVPSSGTGGGGALVAGTSSNNATGGDGAGTAINPSPTVGTPGPTPGVRYFSGGGRGCAPAGGFGGVGGGSPPVGGYTPIANTGGGGQGDTPSAQSGIVIIRYKYQ